MTEQSPDGAPPPIPMGSLPPPNPAIVGSTTGAPPANSASPLVARLRAELAAQHDRGVQSLLLNECASVEEAAGEEAAAARDYLASFNADQQFREPLEALVRILSRRKSIKNLGKLYDALLRAAATHEEQARAAWERAAYLHAYEQNDAGARALYEEALTQSPEEPALWLELELVAARQGDAAGRARALETRAELATDPTWKGLLLVELAELVAGHGRHESGPHESARAYELLAGASALEGKARFRTQLVIERIAAAEGNQEALSRALEGQANLIEEAVDDDARGDATGVPRWMRRPEHAADAWLRAASVYRRTGDEKTAASMIERAGRRLPESSVIVHARIAALEALGDLDGAAALAKKELERDGGTARDGASLAGGSGAAALWLRVAEAAGRAKDRAGAIDALRKAIAADPRSIPARALEIDQLADGQDPAALAAALEALADTHEATGPKGRALLLAAHVWAAQASDGAASQRTLARAAAAGVPAIVIARIARTLASLLDDAAWYEEATRALLEAGAAVTAGRDTVDIAERASLWLELGRSLAQRGDAAGAADAFAKLDACDPDNGPRSRPGLRPDEASDALGVHAWLGRALGAYAVGLVEAPSGFGADAPIVQAGAAARKAAASADAIERLAAVEPDADAARALLLASAWRRARAGELDQARARLRELHVEAPGDAVIALFLAELDRRAGDRRAAAAVLAACAAVSGNEPELATALNVEAALLLWKTGDRAGAIDAIEAARNDSPGVGAALLSWALRGSDPDSLAGRRRALDAAVEAGADGAVAALERFGLESASGDPDAALAALERLESKGRGDLAVAAAIARVLWPAALEVRPAVFAALDRLAQEGGDATALALAERFRLARADVDDPAGAAIAAEAWFEAEPKLYTALEWLGASLAAGSRDAEIAARRAVAACFEDATRSAIEASAAVVGMLDQPTLPQPFVPGEEAPSRLMNLELAPPGCDPRRRSAALHALGSSLGDEAQLDAVALGAWSDLAAGRPEEARESFRRVLERRPKELAAWEGVRAASEALGDHVQTALACAQLGSVCRDAERGAELWERAGVILSERADAKSDAEIAFARAFERDPRRAVAFDKLFRAVRARNEDDKLLAIIDKRLDVSDEEQEIGKLYWERARVLRKKGDLDAALAALEDVTMLEPDHVGALALLGEICITKGKFAEAAPHLAKLAGIEEAPKQQRLMSGIAAVDLFENKLQQPQKALEVLLRLHRAGLSTLPVRERLARVAARAGAWSEATAILEALMNERDKREGRMEAARLAMSIWRDKLNAPARAAAAVMKLLDEAPDDAEGVEFVLAAPFEAPFKARVLGRARQTLLASLHRDPVDAPRVELLAKIAKFADEPGLRQATLGCLVALGRNSAAVSEELARLDGRVASSRPQAILDAAALAEIADPEDHGPIADLFAALAETIMLGLGPSLSSLGVGRRERVDSRGGHPLRLAVAEWMGALGLPAEFELYVGGANPRAVHGIPGDEPALVLGNAVSAPFDAATRSAVAREVFALKRGITSVRSRDEHTIASIVTAASVEAGIAVPPLPYAVYPEVARAIRKEMPRKVRKAIPELCEQIRMDGLDARAWALAAQQSLDRMALVAAADVSIVLGDVLSAPRSEISDRVSDSDRARRLLGFVLSPSYLELRKKLGMGVR